MSTAVVKITKNLEKPVEAGKYHRIICMTGKNKGLCYYLNSSRVVMGRSTSVDIQILDNKASREHLELAKSGNTYVLTDLESQNGVFVNDLKVSQHKLKSGDKIIVGSTVYKYSYVEVKQELVVVDDEDDDEEEEEESFEKKEKKRIKKKTNDPAAQRKRIIYIVVAALLGFMFLDSGEDSKKKQKKSEPQEATRLKVDKNTGRKSNVEKEVELKVKAYIHRGRREAREGNYFRAMEEFQLALMLDPLNGDASFHMNKAKQRLDEKVKVMNVQATKFKDALKYHQAKGTYCSVVKLLKDYPEDERFKEAEKNAKDMAQRIGQEESENYCN